jgi:putative ATPase
MAEQSSLFGSNDKASDHKKTSPTSARDNSLEGVSMPLAARMRPRTLDEIIGQESILAPGKVLRRSIEADAISSMIFWGPPGSGKTTLAEVIAHHSSIQRAIEQLVRKGFMKKKQINGMAGWHTYEVADMDME